MKQILLTLNSTVRSQIEIKDFLKECKHSPQWIGHVEQWDIKSFTYVERGNKIVPSALLENRTWTEPVVISLTLKKVCEELVKYKDRFLTIGQRMGVDGKIEEWNFGKISIKQNDNEYCALTLEKNNPPYVTVDDFFKAIELDWLDSDNSEDEWNTIHLPRNYKTANVLLDFQSEKFLGYPVTEVIVEKEKVFLIFNQDIEIK